MKKSFFLFCVWFVQSVFFNIDAHGDWTWLYRTTLAEKNRSAYTHKKSIIIAHDGINPFTQLIFSWNIIRPAEGYFSFFAQARNAATQKWGKWHALADWGKDIQKTYASKSDGFSSYAHVRLEIDEKKYADGFRIKIEPHNNADLSLVHALYVATSNFGLFKPEASNDVIPTMKTVILSGIAKIAQFALEHEDNHRICSPISCAMVVQYLMNETIDPIACALGVYDTGLAIYGSWACNTAYAFNQCKGNALFYVKRSNSFFDIYKDLEKGVPSIVSVRGILPGALKPFPHGHLLVVSGWDNASQEVVCHDPAAYDHESVIKRYPLDDFLRAWERSHRLTYSIERIYK